MRRRRRSSTATLATKTLDLSLAASQVVAHRLRRLAAAGFNPSASDRREFMQMGSEKLLAFQQSWAAMWTQLALAQFEAWRALYALPPPSARATARRKARTVSRVLAAGIAPVHAKAMANAKRLARKRR